MDVLKRSAAALAALALGVQTGYAEAPAAQVAALQDFGVREGLKAELWAGNDMVNSPLAIDIDDKGRLWVTEDLQKSNVKGRNHARILILSDTDNDGKADKVQEFGPTFRSKPMGISVFDNVVVVSMAPNVHVYTDVDRNDVFDPKVDKETIIAKGFHGQGHDHALHQVVPGPSGKWYLNHGNIGADLTMPDGREIHSSSYYSQNPKSIGKKSYDDRVYVGGFGLRMNPDGSDAEVIFENTRNTHAMVVTSFGDVLHADNDDPTHARGAWAMENANFGYASLEDGSRSWEDSAKTWEKREVTKEIAESAYERHGRSVLRVDDGHWRQHYPGVTPPGDVWGPGAPTGDYFIEGDELGKDLRGRYLVCETVHRALFSFRPELRDAQVELLDLDKRFFDADRQSKNAVAAEFLPSDVTAGLDGSLFVSDWNSRINGRGAGNAMGGIYRLTKKDATGYVVPKVDFASTAGLLAALKSPAPSIRWVAQDRLKKQADAYDALRAFYDDNADNPYYQARAVFVLAQIADKRGPAFVENLLANGNEQFRIVAFRALRFSREDGGKVYLARMLADTSAAVRREALPVVRNLPYAEAKPLLAAAIQGYDGKNRWYLEALGAACDGRLDAVYAELVKPKIGAPATWDDRAKNLAWRLRSSEARADLLACILAQKPAIEAFRQLAYTFSLCYTPEERKENVEAFKQLSAAFPAPEYQLVIDEFVEKDVKDEGPTPLTQSYLFPKTFGGEPTKVGTAKEVAALTPNVANGQAKAAICAMCHQVGPIGVAFGPNLSNWAQVRDVESIVHAIIDPAAELAHGYDKPVRVSQNGHVLEGVLRNYSYHAGSIRVKTMGGQTVHLPFRRPGANIDYLKNHSWMPSASAMSLTSQDVRDIAEYLRNL